MRSISSGSTAGSPGSRRAGSGDSIIARSPPFCGDGCLLTMRYRRHHDTDTISEYGRQAKSLRPPESRSGRMQEKVDLHGLSRKELLQRGAAASGVILGGSLLAACGG